MLHRLLVPRATWPSNLKRASVRRSSTRRPMHGNKHGAVDSVYDNAFLTESRRISPTPFHLIVLNYALPSFTGKLWQRARYKQIPYSCSRKGYVYVLSTKILADGGANRFYDQFRHVHGVEDTAGDRLSHPPDVICGDMDSIRPDVLSFYKSHRVPIRDLAADQDSTDTEKCIAYIYQQYQTGSLKPAQTCIIGSLGGRLDHTLANLHVMHVYKDMDIVMIGEGNCARLIKEGKTRIKIEDGIEGPTCGLVPLNGAVKVTVTGLQWPLCQHELKFEGLISTSNSITSDVIEIESNGMVVWISKLHESTVNERLSEV